MDWLFQCNPRRWDLASKLESDPASQDEWTVSQGRNLISPGDRLFFWQTGQEAALLALGHVTSPVFERESPFGPYAVGITLDYKVVPPLTRQEATESKILSNFRPFTGAQGTNFAIRDPAIVAELDAVLKGRLVAISSKPMPDNNSQRDLDAAIKRVRQQVANDLRNYISLMDHTAFEWLIRALLLKLGYTNVEVTKRSGDGGVDVRALLSRPESS